MIKIYGIKNCDTMKKAFRWFEDKGIPYEFFDYKNNEVDDQVLKMAMDQHGWDKVINKQSQTWRTVPDDAKENMDRADAELLADSYPSVIKRPLIVYGDQIILGFDPVKYDSIFKV